MPAEPRRRGRPKAFNGPQTQNTIQALDRALDVLDALATPEGKTLSELAGQLGQSAATMHRVLATLERREFVEISPDRQVWHIGPEAYRLGAAFLRRSNVVERSRPIMRELMLETGETSNLGIEKDGNVLFISQVETHESIRAFFPPGTLSPLHASGIGKALLSTYDEDRLSALFKKKNSSDLPKTPCVPSSNCARSCRRRAREAIRSTTRSAPRGCDASRRQS